MVSLINWGITFLAVFVVLVAVLFTAAPSFMRKNRGTATESVSVWLVVLWSLLFTSVIIGGGVVGVWFMDQRKSGKGFGCGSCSGVKWGVRESPNLGAWGLAS